MLSNNTKYFTVNILQLILQWKRRAFIFIDDFSRLTHLYLLKNKSEVPIIFQEFSNLVENQYDAKIKKFRFDNGTEFLNQTMSKKLKLKGIVHQATFVYTPQ
jgi:hypothetical protein